MNKRELIQKIRSLNDITADEKAYLIELVNTKKKYGLVWEDKPEDVEEQLRSMLPVFKEVKERAIISEDKEAPNHILIEGDNLHALTALSYTHEGKIDVIYIDPPYNTGNKDFIYNDAYVDKEDSYRHSKWLSFMDKRLRLAKKLLSEKGVIFISIDDNEQSQLKLLCDEVFNFNHIATLPRITKSSGKTTNKIANNHDYILVYALDKNLASIEGLKHFDSGFKYSDEFVNERGLYKLNQTLDYDSLQYSTSLDYVINIDGEEFIPGSDIEKFNLRKLGKHKRADWAWRWSKDLFQFGLDNGFIVIKRSKNGARIYTKTYLNCKIKQKNGEYYIDYFERKKPLTSLEFIDNAYSNDNAKKQLDKVLKQDLFDYPKPIGIVQTLLKTNPNLNLRILDFFAGSGTTLHATMALNAEDGGNRQCILVTNNENNIAEEVTYERNKRVIQGYTNAKGQEVEGLVNNNLRYFQADFVPSQKTEKNRRLLTARSTDLLCIKEDCFLNHTKDFGLDKKQAQIFTNGLGKYMVVIYYTRNQEEIIEQLNDIIANLETEEKVRVYAFSPEKELIEDDLFKVADKIEAVPLPDSIYNAFRATFRTLKLDKKEAVGSNQEK